MWTSIYQVHSRDESTTHSLGQVTRALRGVEDFVVEDGKVEGEAQADRVGGGKVLVCQVRRRLVRLECVGRAGLSVLCRLELGKIPVVLWSIVNFMRMKSTVRACWSVL